MANTYFKLRVDEFALDLLINYNIKQVYIILSHSTTSTTPIGTLPVKLIYFQFMGRVETLRT